MPREFAVIIGMENEKIDEIVVRAFEENNGRVPLEELTRRLVKGIKFDPIIVLSEGDPKLDECRGCNCYEYELKDGIIYRFPSPEN